MSYDSKIASAQKIIDEHNSNATKQISFDDFLSKLNELGGTSNEALKASSWEDLQDCGLPKIMARRVSYIFRQEGDGAEGKSTYISEKKAAGLSYKELVERYNPKDIKNQVGKRLQDLSDDKKFILFDDNSKVIIDATVSLLQDIIDGLPEISTAFVDGRPLPVHSLGDRPDSFMEENPIYPGRPLRSEEKCDQTGRSWQGVDIPIRQLLNLAIQTNELEIKSVSDAHDILDKVLLKDCVFDNLRARYPEASKIFDEGLKTGKLPLLKIRLTITGYKTANNNPFGSNRTF